MGGVTAVSVLIIDDDPFFGRGLEDELGRTEAVVVLARATTLAGAFATDGTPDVVLLDLGLPGTCKRLAIGDVRSRWPSASVLVVTAYSSGTDVVLAFASPDRSAHAELLSALAHRLTAGLHTQLLAAASRDEAVALLDEVVHDVGSPVR